jgi:hypothetical protein
MSGLAGGMQGLSLGTGAASAWQSFPIPPGAATLFAEADADGDGQVGRGDAKAFFVRTGIPGPTLAKVQLNGRPCALTSLFCVPSFARPLCCAHTARVSPPLDNPTRSGPGATSAPERALHPQSSQWPSGASRTPLSALALHALPACRPLTPPPLTPFSHSGCAL